jgi:hypothetical protein
MTAITRRSLVSVIGTPVTLATADDLNGTSDGTQEFNITGARRVIVQQLNNGTAGTAGIDVIEVSHDGIEWAADATIMPIANNDTTGDIVVTGILNAAGVEPTLEATFKGGPYEGPTWMRCTRNVSTNAASAAWVTGAPTVRLIPIGIPSGGGAIVTTPVT